MIPLFYKDLGVVGIKDSNSDLQVLSVLQQEGIKRPAINAYLGARYSRSSDSIVDILKEVISKGTDASKRLESIFHGYGHRSVGQMAIPTIFFEQIPMITATRLFNLVPTHAGQERSTRYQDYSKPNYVKAEFSNPLLDLGYKDIMNSAFAYYKSLYEETYMTLRDYFSISAVDKYNIASLKARTLDTARYLLPCGTLTNADLVTDAASLSDLISTLSASNQKVETKLAELLFSLLTGNKEVFKQTSLANFESYVPEVDTLIRHAQPNITVKTCYEEILKLIKKDILNNPFNLKIKKYYKPEIDTYEGFDILNPGSDLSFTLLENFIMLLEPHLNGSDLLIHNNIVYPQIAEILAQFLDHRNQLGNIAQTGAAMFDGYMDIGMLRDLNRHRSLERFIPFLDNNFNLEAELEVRTYNLCPYLDIPELRPLRIRYVDYLENAYDSIEEWVDIAKQELPPEQVLEYGRYLLPLAHNTRYRFSGSFDDLLYVSNLRTRPGGHIAYRMLTYNWLEKLTDSEPLFRKLLDNITKPDFKNLGDFLDRS